MSDITKIDKGGVGGQNCIFLDEPKVTFINYGSGKNYSYRRAARLHNARRQAQQYRRPKSKTSSATAAPAAAHATSKPDVSCIDTPAKLLRTPSGQDIVFPSHNLETTWRKVFSENFHLPVTAAGISGIVKPADAFLSAAWSTQSTYRSLVVLTVAASEARTNQQVARTVFRNQAHVLQEFRQLALTWTNPQKRLTKSEFQHLFALNFSFFNLEFGKASAYAAMMSVNAAVFTLPENLFEQLCPVTEWIRTLMPRPGPTFDRSQPFQSIMLNKINMVLDFLEECQEAARSGVAKEVQECFSAGTALHEIISTKIPAHVTIEHNPSFYSICFHRVMFLLHVHLKKLDSTNVRESKKFLTKLEGFAAECLDYEPAQAITLFLWALLSDKDGQLECHDPREKIFSWALKDLIEVHNISFEEDLAFWLLYQGGDGERITMPLMDTQSIRKKMKTYYEP